MNPPALAILSHTPEDATQTIAWVGKGIVYDTGGLSIKSKVIQRYLSSFPVALPLIYSKQIGCNWQKRISL